VTRSEYVCPFFFLLYRPFILSRRVKIKTEKALYADSVAADNSVTK
jgi:hypothetical protein